MKTRLELLQQMLAESPDDSFLEYGIALEIAKTNLAEGIAKLTELTRKSPGYLPSYYRLGALLVENNQEEQALFFLQKGLELAKVQKEAMAAKEIQALIEELTF
jgi:Flp pilus assembly protein TadD